MVVSDGFSPPRVDTGCFRSFENNIPVARMSTYYLKAKSLGSRIPTYPLLSTYLGYSMYMLFVYTYHAPVQ